MSNSTKNGRPPLGGTKNAEIFLKLGAVLVGTLYVIGLLISNIHLSELGISDFSSLRAKNILAGFLFIMYIFFPVSIAISAPFSVYLFLAIDNTRSVNDVRPRLSTFKFASFVILLASFLTLTLVVFAGSLFQLLYPWGDTWKPFGDLSVWSWSSFQAPFRYFMDTYFYAKSLTAFVVFFGYTIWLLFFGDMFFDAEDDDDPEGSNSFFNWPNINLKMMFMVLWAGLPAFVLFLFDYSYNIYPNIPYNLGGAQPRLVSLHLNANDKQLQSFLGKVHFDDIHGTATTETLALWYRDERFFYVSEIYGRDGLPSMLVEVDGDLVRVVQHVPGYVRILSGGEIGEYRIGNY